MSIVGNTLNSIFKANNIRMFYFANKRQTDQKRLHDRISEGFLHTIQMPCLFAGFFVFVLLHVLLCVAA